MKHITSRALIFFCALSWLNSGFAVEIGSTAPNCALTQFSTDKKHNLVEFRPKLVLVDFWTSWCGPCMKSFPYYNQLQQHFGYKDLHIVAVNLDEDLTDAQAFIKRFPANFTVATDPEKQCAQQFSVVAMPSSYLIDRNGTVRHVHLGFRPDETGEVESKIKELLAEQQP